MADNQNTIDKDVLARAVNNEIARRKRQAAKREAAREAAKTAAFERVRARAAASIKKSIEKPKRYDGSPASSPSPTAMRRLPLLRGPSALSSDALAAHECKARYLTNAARVWEMPAAAPFSLLPPPASALPHAPRRENLEPYSYFYLFTPNERPFRGTLMCRCRGAGRVPVGVSIGMCDFVTDEESAVFDIDTNLHVFISSDMLYVKMHGLWDKHPANYKHAGETIGPEANVDLTLARIGACAIVIMPGDDITMLRTDIGRAKKQDEAIAQALKNAIEAAGCPQDSDEAIRLARGAWGLAK